MYFPGKKLLYLIHVTKQRLFLSQTLNKDEYTVYLTLFY